MFVPHATAGLVIVEIGAGSDDDLLAALDRLLPREDRCYRHRHGSPGHGADHVLPLLAPPSLTVPVVGGRLALGTWQSICLLDPNADNATRTVRLELPRRLTARAARPGAAGAPVHRRAAARSARRATRAKLGRPSAAGPALYSAPTHTDPLSTGQAPPGSGRDHPIRQP